LAPPLSLLSTRTPNCSWQVPYLQADGFHFPWGSLVILSTLMITVLQIAAFGLKVLFFCWFLLLIRWTLPRFRYDQLMHLGWKILLPLSILNVFLTGFVLTFLH
jgi:NADH-quinone oxidoreductase subunit H